MQIWRLIRQTPEAGCGDHGCELRRYQRYGCHPPDLSRHPEIKVIGLSMHSEKKIRDAMYDAGAAAFLNKSIPSDELIDRVRECIAGE